MLTRGILVLILLMTVSCRSTGDGENLGPRLPSWIPFVSEPEPPESEKPGWKSAVQHAQGYAAVGFTLTGAALLAIGLLGARHLLQVAGVLIAVGLALLALNEVMDHWLWPWFSLFAFLAFAAWKVHRKIEIHRARRGVPE